MNAIVLLSGGIDSATCLAMANERGRRCHALTVDYSQRNYATESRCADAIAKHFGVVSHHRAIIHHPVIAAASPVVGGAPSSNTYVPARNLMLLSTAIAMAEVVQADEVWFGPNADDMGYYPDCRREFCDAVQELSKIGTKGNGVRVVTPFSSVDKVGVILEAVRLGVPLDQTTTCLMGRVAGQECGRCRACELRRTAMASANVSDPNEYATATERWASVWNPTDTQSCVAGITRN